MNGQKGGFRTNTQGYNHKNWHQSQGNQGRNYGNSNRKGKKIEIETATTKTTSIGVTMLTEIMGVSPMPHLKIGKLFRRIVEVVWQDLRICYRR